jgi:hypothetical protein
LYACISRKSAVKPHTLLDLRGNIPTFVHISGVQRKPGAVELHRASSASVPGNPRKKAKAISVKKVTSLLVFSPACCVAQRVT